MKPDLPEPCTFLLTEAEAVAEVGAEAVEKVKAAQLDWEYQECSGGLVEFTASVDIGNLDELMAYYYRPTDDDNPDSASWVPAGYLIIP